MNERDAVRQASALLVAGAPVVGEWRGVVGLDGFVDKIARVVASRNSAGEMAFIPAIPALAERIGRAAGKSTALELIVNQTKLGGNGPIMANALASFGLRVSYVGAVGDEGGTGVHPVFQPMADRAAVHVVCRAATTMAIEFDDGKIMLQQMTCLDDLDYEAIVAAIGRDALLAMFGQARFVALNHWASLPHMTAIWRRLQDEVCPHLEPGERHIFFDLADPEKRAAGEIVEALETIAGFNRWYATCLGLNEKESEHVCEALACEPHGCTGRELLTARAKAIRERTGIACVVVHPVAYAVAADAAGAALVDGPYTPKPKISTGAGDHFNAGFFLGRLLGGDLATALHVGVGCSGYYVRNAASPSMTELAGFLDSLAD